MSKSEQTSSLQRKRELDGALLYLVETFSKPEATGNRAEYRQAHFEYSEKLSAKGILVGGGPVVNEMDRKPSGAGFWILARVGLRILVGLACGLSLRLACGFQLRLAWGAFVHVAKTCLAQGIFSRGLA